MGRLGNRASGSAAAWQASPAGHPLQHMIPRYVPDAPPPRKSCITSPSPSSPTKTQRMALLPCLRGSSGAGLRPVCLGRNYVEEGDLLEVPAKRRRSPRPASHNVALLSASPRPTPLPNSTQVRYCRYSRLHRSELPKSFFSQIFGPGVQGYP